MGPSASYPSSVEYRLTTEKEKKEMEKAERNMNREPLMVLSVQVISVQPSQLTSVPVTLYVPLTL